MERNTKKYAEKQNILYHVKFSMEHNKSGLKALGDLRVDLWVFSPESSPEGRRSIQIPTLGNVYTKWYAEEQNIHINVRFSKQQNESCHEVLGIKGVDLWAILLKALLKLEDEFKFQLYGKECQMISR